MSCRYCVHTHPVEGTTCEEARLDRAAVMAEEARDLLRAGPRYTGRLRPKATTSGQYSKTRGNELPPGDEMVTTYEETQ